jgi:hypothetical protein
MNTKHGSSSAIRVLLWVSALVAASYLVGLMVNAQGAEGFQVRGFLSEAASDGSAGYYELGSTVIALPPGSPLIPSTKALLGQEVELVLRRVR